MEVENLNANAAKVVTSALLAAILAGCTSASPSTGTASPEAPEANPRSSSDGWAACESQLYADVEPRLRANGQCGASNCFDEEGNSMQQLVVRRCGYPKHTAKENESLMEMIQQAINSKQGLASREIRTLYYYPPEHPVSIAAAKAEAIAAEHRDRKAKAEHARKAVLRIRIGSPLKDVLEKFGRPDDSTRIVTAKGESLILRYGPLLAGTTV